MPAPTVEQLATREASLKKVIGEQGETTEAAKRRATKKKLRRAQRKRRRFVAREAVLAKARAGVTELTGAFPIRPDTAVAPA